ncbi:hypothetical protein G8770_20465 [Aestuariicella hydrocarbonica]|uniref:Uncharacterized protein n=1 Tax=Pseudomaricurvus hydrocarbonicus TaxID=1470433 RepID=A0A9E5MPG2_9GAMM|nr:hypothetical protein [Aestuariicella hydrocarbonica]NHO67928.1 hypothetical protein [Aestuariicella hydrocarbonica]
MKKSLLPLMLVCTFSTAALAEKPEWAGKDKASESPQAEHMQAMEHKEAHGKNEKPNKSEKSEKPEKSEKAKKTEKSKKPEDNDAAKHMKGSDKQAQAKAEQSRNELGKGSEQGQQAREEHSKKWWKFWGE